MLGSRLGNFFGSQCRRSSIISYIRNAAQNVYKNDADDCLVIKWEDKNADEFPYLYLRENCRCPSCYTDTRKSRTMNTLTEVDINITAETAVWNNEGDHLQVRWRDGHTSHYSSDWLKYLRYRPPGEGQPDGVLRKGTKLWGPEMTEEGTMPTFQYETLLNDDEQLYKWLVTMVSDTGIAKVENAPKETGHLNILGDRVGYLLPTAHGLLIEIRAFLENSTNELGYSDQHLPMHSDYVHTQHVPPFAMFHYVKQTKSEGGDNLWVDAFHAASLLYEENPDLFQILASTPVVFRNFTKMRFGKVYGRSSHPLIRLDANNKLKQMCYSDEFRHNHMPLPPKFMKSFYKSYFRYSELLSDKRTSFRYKAKAGDIITFNNH